MTTSRITHVSLDQGRKADAPPKVRMVEVTGTHRRSLNMSGKAQGSKGTKR